MSPQLAAETISLQLTAGATQHDDAAATTSTDSGNDGTTRRNKKAAAPDDGAPLLLSASQAARLVGISTSTLWRLLSANKFPKPVHPVPSLTRFRRADVESYVAKLPQAVTRRPRVVRRKVAAAG